MSLKIILQHQQKVKTTIPSWLIGDSNLLIKKWQQVDFLTSYSCLTILNKHPLLEYYSQLFSPQDSEGIIRRLYYGRVAK